MKKSSCNILSKRKQQGNEHSFKKVEINLKNFKTIPTPRFHAYYS